MSLPRLDNVIITQGAASFAPRGISQVRHRAFPEILAGGQSPREGTVMLIHQMERALDGVADAWHRETLALALADVRAFAEVLRAG